MELMRMPRWVKSPASSVAVAMVMSKPCRVRVLTNVSSRVSVMATQRPPSLCEASATSGSYMVSCLLPKPPPKKGFTTRTSPSGISMASAMLRPQRMGHLIAGVHHHAATVHIRKTGVVFQVAGVHRGHRVMLAAQILPTRNFFVGRECTGVPSDVSFRGDRKVHAGKLVGRTERVHHVMNKVCKS